MDFDINTLLFVMPLISFIFLYYASQLDKKNWAIQMLFSGAAFLLLINAMSLGITMADVAGQPVVSAMFQASYMIPVVVFWVWAFWTLLLIIAETIDKANQPKG